MLGWEVFVYRKPEARLWSLVVRYLISFFRKPKAEKKGVLVVRWQTSVFGLDWLDQLVKDGKASTSGGYGYPSKYTVTAGVLFPIITSGLPVNNSPLVIGDDYVLPEGWNGDIIWNSEAKLACAPGDLLSIHVWDQS